MIFIKKVSFLSQWNDLFSADCYLEKKIMTISIWNARNDQIKLCMNANFH